MGVRSTSPTQPYFARFRETQGGASGPTASATGGTAISDGDDRYNVFVSSDTYTVSGGPVIAKVLAPDEELGLKKTPVSPVPENEPEELPVLPIEAEPLLLIRILSAPLA